MQSERSGGNIDSSEKGGEYRMMKSFKRNVVFRLASVLAGVATILVVTTASIVYINQPDVPEELLK